MTDFYAILKSAIADSDADSPERRAALYARARETLEKQLDALQPPLSAAARQEQRAALEKAIGRLEAESGGKAAAAAPAAPAAAPPAQPKPPETEPAKPEDKAKAEDGKAAPAEAANKVPAEGAKKQPAKSTRRAGRGLRGGRLAALIVLLVVIAGGALAFWQWDSVEPPLTNLAQQVKTSLGIGEVPATSEPAPGDTAMQETAPDMAEETPATPPMERQEPAPAPAMSGEAADGTAQTPSGETPAESPETTPVDQPAETAAVDPAPQQPAETAAEPDKDQARAPSASLPTERAYLIVEQNASDTQDKRFAGTALWSTGGSGADASLAVAVSFPERSADLSLVFRLNTDGALPASHTVDVIYHGPDEPDGPVTNVAGFMVRTEGGEANVPLYGAGALVVPGQFLFGLSGAPSEREHNVTQLKNGDWLLVPVQFESDRRSVVVIEKGETGDAAMAKAFAAWEGAEQSAESQ